MLPYEGVITCRSNIHGVDHHFQHALTDWNINNSSSLNVILEPSLGGQNFVTAPAQQRKATKLALGESTNNLPVKFLIANMLITLNMYVIIYWAGSSTSFIVSPISHLGSLILSFEFPIVDHQLGVHIIMAIQSLRLAIFLVTMLVAVLTAVVIWFDHQKQSEIKAERITTIEKALQRSNDVIRSMSNCPVPTPCPTPAPTTTPPPTTSRPTPKPLDCNDLKREIAQNKCPTESLFPTKPPECPDLKKKISVLEEKLKPIEKQKDISLEVDKRFNRPPYPKLYDQVDIKNITQWKTLPRFALVVNLDAESAMQYKINLSALTCYAALHGYPIYFEFVVTLKDRHYHHGRMRSLQKYLPHFQWILSLDADIWPANMTKKFEDILDDNYDVILSQRECGEPFSQALIKNSQWGRDFLERWLHYSDGGHKRLNTDNGDLLLMLMEEMKPPGYEKCMPHHKSSNYCAFMVCSHHSYVTSGAYKTWKNIKLIPPLAKNSFFRSYKTRVGISAKDSDPFFTRMFPETDFLLHGFKEWYKEIPADDVYCTHEEEDKLRKARYYTPEEAVKWSTHYGFVDYPLCTLANGTNICAQGCQAFSLLGCGQQFNCSGTAEAKPTK
jgi:hypothetical protein